jgi:hypothetical protein
MVEVTAVNLGKRWETFFKKLSLHDSTSVEKWKEYQILGYLISRLERYLQRKFAFTLSGQPSKCPEMFFIKKIIYSLDTKDPEAIKNYIDWVFDTKIIPSKVKLRSVGYFHSSVFANQFLDEVKKSKQITRTTPIPEEYRVIVNFFKAPVETFGDLAFVKKVIESNPEDEDSQQFKKMFINLISIGFKEECLKDLK